MAFVRKSGLKKGLHVNLGIIKPKSIWHLGYMKVEPKARKYIQLRED